jgi:general secretion pathway protein F
MKSRMVMPAGVFLLALIIEPLPGLASGSLGLFGYLFQVLRPLLVVGAMFFAARWWLSRPVDEAKQKAASPLCSLPLIGRLIVRQNVRDYFESLALMLEAGLPMLDALPLALDTITEPPIKREFSRVAPRVTGGTLLSQAIADLVFLGSAHSRQRLISFIHTGEQSGALPEMLLRHTAMETGAINDTFELLATWAPRVVYGLVALWMIVSIFSAPGLAPPQLGG